MVVAVAIVVVAAHLKNVARRSRFNLTYIYNDV